MRRFAIRCFFQFVNSDQRAGPLDARVQRLVKLALAVAKESPGAVRSNVRKALEAGDSADEIRQVVLLAITTCGFPTAAAGMQWVDEVLDRNA